jgi:PleD family two-component response regulator
MEIGLLQCDFVTIDAANVYSAIMKSAQLMPEAVIIDIARNSTKGLLIIKALRRSEKTRRIPVILMVPQDPPDLINALKLEYGVDEREGEWRKVAVVKYPVVFARVVETLRELLAV